MPHASPETRCNLCNRPVMVEDFFTHLRVVHQVMPDERTVADVPVALANPLSVVEASEQGEYYSTLGH